jgi:hypothetical protein
MNSLRKIAFAAMIAGMAAAPSLVSAADPSASAACPDPRGLSGSTAAQSPTDTGSLAGGGDIGSTMDEGLQSDQGTGGMLSDRSGFQADDFEDPGSMAALDDQQRMHDRHMGESFDRSDEFRTGMGAGDLLQHDKLSDLEMIR